MPNRRVLYRQGIDICIPKRYSKLMAMNPQVREAAKVGMAARGLSQVALAERTGVKQATVSRLLAGARQGEPETWQRLLDAVGLELVAVPKGTDVSKLTVEEGE